MLIKANRDGKFIMHCKNCLHRYTYVIKTNRKTTSTEFSRNMQRKTLVFDLSCAVMPKRKIFSRRPRKTPKKIRRFNGRPSLSLWTNLKKKYSGGKGKSHNRLFVYFVGGGFFKNLPMTQTTRKSLQISAERCIRNGAVKNSRIQSGTFSSLLLYVVSVCVLSAVINPADLVYLGLMIELWGVC